MSQSKRQAGQGLPERLGEEGTPGGQAEKGGRESLRLAEEPDV